MGLFDWFTSAESKRAEEVRTGVVAPAREERKKCWEARDTFYSCLDKNDVIDSLSGDGKRTAEKQCAQESRQFEQDCASSWVSSGSSGGYRAG
jgi:cytochrome c oxidase assembly factor 6